MKKYWLSFVEEFWQGQLPKHICRIEVYEQPEKSTYATEEIHFCTDDEEEYYDFRETWDGKEVDQIELEAIKNTAKFLEEEWVELNKEKK